MTEERKYCLKLEDFIQIVNKWIDLYPAYFITRLGKSYDQKKNAKGGDKK